MSQNFSSYTNPLLRLVVDLDAIAQNYLILKNMLAGGADCSAVVKADAYGLGAVPITKMLHAQGCRHFFVAQADEIYAIRAEIPMEDQGLESHLYVLDGPRGIAAKDLIHHSATPVLNSLSDIEYWVDVAKSVDQKLPAVIHIDTGMNRLGLSGAEVKALAKDLSILDALDVRYVMSHLACADTPNHPQNAAQLAQFDEYMKIIGRTYRLSLANSAGIFLGSDYHFDLARPGCSLYGIAPQNDHPNPMSGVVRFDARILQTRLIDSHGTVGYGAEVMVEKGMTLATIAVGYADGYHRTLKNKGTVMINGKSCPVMGRMSMDSIVVDVTHLDQKPNAGDWAEVIGAHQTVDDVAAQAGTIGYEILTSLGTRAKRIYTSNVG